jgi:hypothetical protein
MLQDLKGGEVIAISKASAIRYPRWSSDGSDLAAVLYDPPQLGLFLTPRLGGPPRLIAKGGFPCWSPDGSQIATAWAADGGFTIVDKLPPQRVALPEQRKSERPSEGVQDGLACDFASCRSPAFSYLRSALDLCNQTFCWRHRRRVGHTTASTG